MLEHEGLYYWVGENRGEDDRFKAVSLYSSSDLVTWTHINDILTTASDPELDGATIERPKLLFNEQTQRFVLWLHWENGQDYSQARSAVATSSDVAGDYDYEGSFRPLGFESRDQTVFQDEDGAGYLVSATASNADLNIYRLSSDYIQPEELVAHLWPGAFREAPAIFVRDGVYFLVSSGATGWDSNQAKYATATDLAGPWTDLADFGDAEAFDSQTAYVLPVNGSEGTTYLYQGDRWAGARGGLVNESDYVWLPLEFPTPETLAMSWAPSLDISAATGVIGATSSSPSLGAGSPFGTMQDATSGYCLDAPNDDEGTGLIFYECNGGPNQQWQALPGGDGSTLLRSRAWADCLSTTGDGSLVLATCSDAPEQRSQEILTSTGGTTVRINEACLSADDAGVGTTTDCSRAGEVIWSN